MHLNIKNLVSESSFDFIYGLKNEIGSSGSKNHFLFAT
jgi:hypothetical protein